jgi:hypothetical protein
MPLSVAALDTVLDLVKWVIEIRNREQAHLVDMSRMGIVIGHDWQALSVVVRFLARGDGFVSQTPLNFSD